MPAPDEILRNQLFPTATQVTRSALILKISVMNFFLAFGFCLFCVVIRFFIPATTANDLRLRRIFYPRFHPLHLFSYLNASTDNT